MNNFIDGIGVPFPENDGSGTSVPPKKKSKQGEAEASLPGKRHSHLQHIDLEGHYQFITFRTHDSIDEYVKRIYDLNLQNKQKQYEIDKYLDQSPNGAYLNGEVFEYLYDFLKSKDGVLYNLIAFVIMDNHIHLHIKPLDKLSVVMQIVKGSSSRVINEMLNKKGKFWANDYYDKAIRNEKHFWVVYEYIKNNPFKIGEAEASLPNRFYGVYDA